MVGECSKFSSFQDSIDDNGDVVSSWAEHVKNKANHFRCRVCGSSDNSFKRGLWSFNQHAKTDMHKNNMKKAEKYKKQLNIAESFKVSAGEDEAEKEFKKKVQNFEIDLNRRLIHHNVTLEFLPCIVDCLKTHLSGVDSQKIVEKVSLGVSKGRYVAKFGIAKTYFEETVEKLKTCDGFSVGFDESEINKLTELIILVVLADKNGGIELRHYRTVELAAKDAETITNTIVEQFEADQIPWKEKLVAPMTDGCNVMQGRSGGVKKLLSDRAPQVVDLGSCNDHHLGNAARYGCEEIKASEDYDNLPAMFIDLYYDLGAAPGKGNKRKLKFEQIAKQKGRKIKSFHKYGNTRFKGYQICIEPILFNWENLFEYYSIPVEKPHPRHTKLKTFFVDREFESLLKLEFVMASTRDIMEGISYFEERENKIHLARKKMENVLRLQLLKFIKSEKVENVDAEGNVTKKEGHELLLVDVENKENYLSQKLVFIGQKCEELIESFGLTPSSAQLNDFFTMVFNFYKEMATKLIKYFSTGLRSIELEYMEGFSPMNQRSEDAKTQILFLAGSFSKIVKNIRPIDGFDKLRSEVDLYKTDPDVDKISKAVSYNKYWLEVSKIKEGKWVVYEVLPRLALVLGTPFNSGAEMERGFSIQSDIHRDPKRNQMSHETLDSQMQIRFGMESKESRSKCDKCRDNADARCLCHCKFAEISDVMRMNCSNASSLRRKEEVPTSNIDTEEVAENNNSSFKKRIDSFKNKVSKRTSLYGGKSVAASAKTLTLDPRTVAMEERKRRNNNNKSDPNEKRRKKKVPIRNSKDNESDIIDDI